MKTICLDFDGVCNTYDGWKGEAYLFEPREGLQEFITALRDAGCEVFIHSTRDAEQINGWLYLHGITGATAVSKKPPALCYLDDRAVRFNGSFDAILAEVLNFRAFWEAGLPEIKR